MYIKNPFKYQKYIIFLDTYIFIYRFDVPYNKYYNCIDSIDS